MRIRTETAVAIAALDHRNSQTRDEALMKVFLLDAPITHDRDGRWDSDQVVEALRKGGYVVPELSQTVVRDMDLGKSPAAQWDTSREKDPKWDIGGQS